MEVEVEQEMEYETQVIVPQRHIIDESLEFVDVSSNQLIEQKLKNIVVLE